MTRYHLYLLMRCASSKPFPLYLSLSHTHTLSLFLSRRTVCAFSSSFHLIISIRIMTFHVFLIKITSKNDASERTRR